MTVRAVPGNRDARPTRQHPQPPAVLVGDAGGHARRLAADEMQVAIDRSSLGLVLVARGARGVAAVLLGDDRDALRRDLQGRFPGAMLTEGDATLQTLAAGVVRMVESPARGAHDVTLPLDLRGTEFQQTVWRALREIPAGSTATYTEIAERIGMPSAVRAVAQACAANALALLVPCHRVVRSDGTPSGYRWGLHRKRALLEREAAT